MIQLIDGVQLTPLKKIIGGKGNVYHGIKKKDASFFEFGEAYFSTVEYKAIKGWKKHMIMVSNLIVPVGAIRFVLYDDRVNSLTKGNIMDITLSLDQYKRLTIPTNIWMAFQGVKKGTNMLLNISSISHNPSECLNLEIGDSQIPFNQW